MIYLDNAATSFPKPASVPDAVVQYLKEVGGSPGRAGHTLARKANDVVFRTRECIAELFGVERSERIVFTANATEALNTAIKGVLSPGHHVVTTSLEHNAVLRPLFALRKKGLELTIVRSDGGPVSPRAVRNAIRPNTRLIVTVYASNVTGAIMPVEEIGEIARRHGLIYLVDGAQAAGSIPVNLSEAPIDMFAFTGHKGMLGPMGTGGLYMAEHIDVEPLKEGGTGSDSSGPLQPEPLPDRLEAGTLNGPGIAGLAAAVQYIKGEGIAAIRERELALANRLEEAIQGARQIKIRSERNARRRIAITSITIEGLESGQAAFELDQRFNICVRGGLHCAPEAHKSIGSFPEGMVRFSPGPFTTSDEIDAAIEGVLDVATGRKGKARNRK